MILQVLNLPRDEAAMKPVVSSVFAFLAGMGVNPDPDAMCGVWAANFLKVIASMNDQKQLEGLLLLASGENYITRQRTATVLGMWGNNQAGLYDLASTVAQALGASRIICEGDAEYMGALTSVREKWV